MMYVRSVSNLPAKTARFPREPALAATDLSARSATASATERMERRAAELVLEAGAAKAAAATAIHQGISAEAFERHYAPTCRSITRDNAIGRLVFAVNEQLKRQRIARRAILRMVAREQASRSSARRMSGVLWDLFTGSAPYREVLLATLHPAFLAGLGWNLVRGLTRTGSEKGDSDVAWRTG